MESLQNPSNAMLWQAVHRTTMDALTKMRSYLSEPNDKPSNPRLKEQVSKYGYKALFATPIRDASGVARPHNFEGLDGLAELIKAVEAIDHAAGKFMLPAELADSPADRQVIEREVAMVPLVLAERFLLDQTPEADEVKLARLYLDQEQYILGRDLHVDVIVPILGAHFEQDIDSGAYSVVGIDEDLRLALSAEDNIPTSDLVTAAHATHALVIRDSTAVIGGHGFYFVVDPSPETKDLIDRFFEGAAIELPAGTTFVQVAARPLGWVGQFEVRRGGVYTHLLRDYPVRMDKAANIQSWLMVDPDQSERIAHDVQALAESHPSVRVAARRLVRSRDRDDDEDRIIDLCIGLEAMLGTGSGETVHRLSIRAAAILGPLGWGKSRAVYDLVRDVYSYRSRVVHGTPGPHKKDLLEVDGIPMHASRVAIAALCAILHIALSQPGFKPDHVDNDFIFGAFDRSAEGLTEN